MGGKIDQGQCLSKLKDAPMGVEFLRRIWPNAIGRAVKRQLLGIGGVASQEDRVVTVLDDDREMSACVARCRYQQNVARTGERQALGEGTIRAIFEVQ
jgi:hypothetical protein